MYAVLTRAYLTLLVFDFYLIRGNFGALCAAVRRCRPAVAKPSFDAIDRVCSAVDLASVWYPKQVLCLQRSAATTCLLKRFGVPAQLVIGAQRLPFKAHAWVEVDGRVVNDKPYTPEMYAVLDRC